MTAKVQKGWKIAGLDSGRRQFAEILFLVIVNKYLKPRFSFTKFKPSRFMNQSWETT